MRDHRKSARRATSTSRLHCELTLGSVVLPAMLLNESGKGFGVLVGGMPSISANQGAQLRNYRGWFECEIVYAMEVTPATTAIYKAAGLYEGFKDSADDDDDDGATHITAFDIDKFTASTKGPWFRLGIRCLNEINPALGPATSLPVESGSFDPMQWIKNVLPSLFDR